MSIRLRLSEKEANVIYKLRGNLNNTVENITSDSDYDTSTPFKFDAIGADGKLLSINDYCLKYGLDASNIRSYKLISHTSVPFYNIVFNSDSYEATSTSFSKDDLDSIINKYIKPIPIIGNDVDLKEGFDRLVFSDVHIGMDVKNDGDALFDGEWGKEELFVRLEKMVKFCNYNSNSSNLLIVDNLGDYLDGQDGKTTRRGHDLPQNMSNKEAFDISVHFSVAMIESFVYKYNKIVYNFITCDNHSGDFAYYAGQAIKGILEGKYANVTVNVIRKFMHHYSVGNHTFILCHGKDDQSLKFGFKPQLDLPQAKKIDHYIKENNLYDGKFIEFSKGDSHLSLFDESTSTDFHYYNYPSFSPPSNWVKTNFSNTKSGFRFFNIRMNDNIKTHHPYWF